MATESAVPDRSVFARSITARNLTHTVLVTMISILSACSPGQVEIKEGTEQTFDLGRYTVKAPSRGNWKAEIAKGEGRVSFMKQPPGGGLPTTMIQVSYNWLAQEETWEWSEEKVADNYRTGETVNMFMQGVSQGLYELLDEKKDAATLDGKRLYTLSYKQMNGKLFGTDKIAESILYLYFPPNFKETHIFYVFIITEVNKRDNQEAADLTPILPVINSFHLK